MSVSLRRLSEPVPRLRRRWTSGFLRPVDSTGSVLELYHPLRRRSSRLQLSPVAADAEPQGRTSWRDTFWSQAGAPIHRVALADGAVIEVALLDKRAQKAWLALDLPPLN